MSELRNQEDIECTDSSSYSLQSHMQSRTPDMSAEQTNGSRHHPILASDDRIIESSGIGFSSSGDSTAKSGLQTAVHELLSGREISKEMEARRLAELLTILETGKLSQRRIRHVLSTRVVGIQESYDVVMNHMEKRARVQNDLHSCVQRSIWPCSRIMELDSNAKQPSAA